MKAAGLSDRLTVFSLFTFVVGIADNDQATNEWVYSEGS